jgi:NAD(P)-dependent dehydrogenase (short-subunit alcohol dehydrogenase family)
MKTWLIVGASRGIGLEFVNQLLARDDTYTYAVARNPSTAGLLETAIHGHEDRCKILPCDVTDESSIEVCMKREEKRKNLLKSLFEGTCRVVGEGGSR